MDLKNELLEATPPNPLKEAKDLFRFICWNTLKILEVTSQISSKGFYPMEYSYLKMI